MKLLEYQGKHFLATQGLPIPKGIAVKTEQEMKDAFIAMGGKAVLKIQAPAGGRGKAKGVRLVDDMEQVTEFFKLWSGQDFKGTKIETFLVQELMDFSRELYLSIAFNPREANSVLMFSTQGGVDIETVAKEHPEAVLKLALDPLTKYTKEYFIDSFHEFSDELSQIDKIGEIAFQLYTVYNQFDLLLLEINPLAVLTNGEVRLADVKLEVDDSALFRQPEFQQYQQMPTDELELEALRIGVNFVRLNGNVALIASGAGLNMNAMDNIKSTGLEAANFLDTGGGITSKMMIDSMKLVEKLPDVKAILFSIYGGVNPLVEMAKGVVAGKAELTRDIIVVVKAMGNYQDECWDILEDNNIKAIKNHRIEDALAYIKEQLEGLSI